MGIRFLKSHAALEGHVPPEDAEALLAWVRTQRRPAVHLGHCQSLHTAVLQVLLAARPTVKVPPAEPRLASLLAGLPQTPTRSNP